MIDLNQVSEYSFDLAKGEKVENRFRIHLKNNKITSLEDELKDNGVFVFSSDRKINMQFQDLESAKAQINVFDLSGKLITSEANQKNP